MFQETINTLVCFVHEFVLLPYTLQTYMHKAWLYQYAVHMCTNCEVHKKYGNRKLLYGKIYGSRVYSYRLSGNTFRFFCSPKCFIRGWKVKGCFELK